MTHCSEICTNNRCRKITKCHFLTLSIQVAPGARRLQETRWVLWRRCLLPISDRCVIGLTVLLWLYVYAISIHFVGIRLSIQQPKLHPRTSQNAIGISEQQKVHLSGVLFEISWWHDAWYSWVVVHLPIGLLIRYATIIWRWQPENSPIIREGNLEANRSWCQKGHRWSMNDTCRPTAYTP